MKKYKIKFINTDGEVITGAFSFMNLRQVSQFEQQEGIDIIELITINN